MTGSEEFLRYREEDRHESGLLASRTNTLLTSQSFFAVAAAALYNAADGHIGLVKVPLVTIAAVASLSAMLGGQAVRRGFSVLRKWHELGEYLVVQNEKLNPNPIKHYYLSDKKYRPRTHYPWLSVDAFGVYLAYLLGLLWLTIIIGIGAS